jgi:hypothetical protein
MDNARCVILVAVHQNVEPHCELSLRQLEGQGYVVRRLYGFTGVDRARNRLATDAINSGFEEMMWIDADIAFEPASVDRLRSHNLPIVGGLYPTKVERRLAAVLLPGTKQIVFGQGGGLLEIRFAPTGFLYTRRQVYLDIQQHENLPVCDRATKPLVPYFMPMALQEGGEAWYLTDDYSFCERARSCGYRIFADTSIRLQHIGLYGYSWEDIGGGLPRYSTYRLDL